MIVIKKLKKKVILVFLISVIGVFAFAASIISVVLTSIYTFQADSTIDFIVDNNGAIPKLQTSHKFDDFLYSPKFNEESEFKTRYFVVYLNSDMNIAYADTNHIAATKESDAKAMAAQVLEQGATDGFIDNYRYNVSEINGVNSIIFLDCTEDIEGKDTILEIMIFVFSCIALLIIIIFIFLSNKVLKPFEINAQKQKQFITDASHELKTPLSIIAANAEVLSYKNGSDQWMDNILSQIDRMSKLINELIVLSKMEELEEVSKKEQVNANIMITGIAESFKENIEKKNVTLSTDTEDVTINANKEQLEQLFSILIENATKYVSENGEIKINLYSSGKYCVFNVYNTAELEKDLDCNNLFERFYRTDSSRSSETGGYGIGLSIAKKVALLHKGDISAKREKDGIKFSAKIALK